MWTLPTFRDRALSVLLGVAAAQTVSPQQPAPPTDPAASSLVIIVSGWPDYHYPGCRRLDGVTENLLAASRAQATARGLKPHEACDPSRPRTADARPAATAGERRPAAKSPPRGTPSIVYIVRGDRRYHLATCRKMGLGNRPIRLAVLDPRFVPCPVCKPPARKSRP